MTARHFCFTSFGDAPPGIIAVGENKGECYEHIRYICMQRERCPTTGKEHWQGYVELDKPSRLTGALELLRIKSQKESKRIEVRQGTREQARDYCRKPQSAIAGTFIERGQWRPGTGQGSRTDIKKSLECAAALGSYTKVCEADPATAIRYANGLKSFFQAIGPTRDGKTNPELSIIWGPTGTGKSLYCYTLYPDAYVKGRYGWWDNYAGEKTIVWHDFDPSEITASQFMEWFDRYPCRAPTKGGQVNLAFTRAVITSHFDPRTWWRGNRFPEIERRALGGGIFDTTTESWQKIFNDIKDIAGIGATPPPLTGRPATAEELNVEDLLLTLL